MKKVFNSINFKITVPPFLLFLIIVVFAVVFGGMYFKNSLTDKAKGVLDSEEARIQNYLNSNVQLVEEEVLIYSQIKGVKEALNLCNTSNVLDSCRLLVSSSFPNGENLPYNIDVVLLDGASLYSNNSIFDKNDLRRILSNNILISNEPTTSFKTIYNSNYLITTQPVIYRDNVVGAIVLSEKVSYIFERYYLSENIGISIKGVDNKLIYSSNIDDYEGFVDDGNSNNSFIDADNYIVKKISLLDTENNNIAKVLIFYSVERDLIFINNLLLYLLLFSFGAFIFGGAIYTYGIYKTILSPVKKINEKIVVVARGEIASELNLHTKDELGQIAKSVDDMIKYRKKNALFAQKIGKGELDTEHNAESEKDEIANALLNMRKALLLAREEEDKYKIEEEKRKWTTKGFAEFGEILRQNNDDIEAFSINILRNLINYTNSNQGGLFIYNDSDESNPVLELVASYAYNRQKYKEKEIRLGEGLVGTCAMEKEIIYLTDVPDDYVEITSGLGHANPRNLLLIPLKVEDKLFGVIELASFDYFEDYKQEFVEKLAESIASSLSSTKVNIMTAQLLEQAQQQQEEMKAQEEELRQNMEEMLATQEESARREAEMEGLYQAINNNSLVADFDLNGNILVINEKFAELFGVDKDSFIGVNYNKISSESEGMTNDELWTKIKAGEVVSIKTKVNASTGKKYWLQQTFAPVKNENGDIYKVINISNDITEEREKEIELRQQQEEMKSQEEEMLQNMDEMLAVQEELNILETKSKIILDVVGTEVLYAEFTLKGLIVNVNDNFIKLFKVENADVFVGKNYLDFSDLANNKEELEEIVEKFKNGEIVKRKSKITFSDGNEFMFNETFTPILDEFDKVVRIIDIAEKI